MCTTPHRLHARAVRAARGPFREELCTRVPVRVPLPARGRRGAVGAGVAEPVGAGVAEPVGAPERSGFRPIARGAR